MTVYDVARRLPAVADLRDLCRSLAMLDAIVSPDWERRYHSFNAVGPTARRWPRCATGRETSTRSIDFPEGAVDPDGATGLFGLLVDRSPEAFQRFAEDYYDVSVDLGAVIEIHALRPLNQALVSMLNPEVRLPDLAQDISEIGYPQPEQKSA